MALTAAKIDWVAAAKGAPVLCIGQHDKADVAALNAAVRRGELIRTTAPFFGRMARKTCYATSQAAVDEMVAADARRFDVACAMDHAARVAA